MPVDYAGPEPIDDMPVDSDIFGTDETAVTAPEPSGSVADEDRGCWDFDPLGLDESEVTADAAVYE